MNDVSELFWQATLQEIKQGYIYRYDKDEFICLICGKSFANGTIYQTDDQLYEARKYIQVHIEQNHGSTFEFLLNTDKKLTGLTEHQKSILELFYKGYSDNEVAKHLNTGSISTIRNHRFSLREKQKQAKIFLAIMELLGEQLPKKQTFVEIARDAKQVKNHLVITQEENEKVLAACFRQGPDGPLQSYPLKEKRPKP